MKHGKHGMACTPEFWAWINMRERCTKQNHPEFFRYGARGITVHPEWLREFKAFFSYVGPRPSPRHSLDRIDNNRGYEPGNVRWATHRQQMRNTSINHWIEIDGERKLASDWAAQYDLHYTTIFHRIARGMSERDAVLTPARYGGRRASKRRNGVPYG